MGEKHNLATVAGVQAQTDEAVQGCLAQRLPHPNAPVDAGADWETPSGRSDGGIDSVVFKANLSSAKGAQEITRGGRR
jgi:hypothetical protein